MKRFLTFLTTLLLTVTTILATNLNEFQYVFIRHQNDAPKDIEARLIKEFDKLGFVVLSEKEFNDLDEELRIITLTAEYFCRQSAMCLFKIKLISKDEEIVYEDEQVAAAGFMTYKNDRQSAIKKIFKQLKKMNYKFSSHESTEE